MRQLSRFRRRQARRDVSLRLELLVYHLRIRRGPDSALPVRSMNHAVALGQKRSLARAPINLRRRRQRIFRRRAKRAVARQHVAEVVAAARARREIGIEQPCGLRPKARLSPAPPGSPAIPADACKFADTSRPRPRSSSATRSPSSPSSQSPPHPIPPPAKANPAAPAPPKSISIRRVRAPAPSSRATHFRLPCRSRRESPPAAARDCRRHPRRRFAIPPRPRESRSAPSAVPPNPATSDGLPGSFSSTKRFINATRAPSVSVENVCALRAVRYFVNSVSSCRHAADSA